MILSLHPYQLKFKHPFKIAHGIRSYTDVVFVKLQHQGFTAWGEAALPPYQHETQQSVFEYIEAFQKRVAPDNSNDWFEKLNEDHSKDMAAKAALDMALWSLKAQIQNTTITQLAGIETSSFPLCTYTIGISSKQEMEQKVIEALQYGFELFKLKLTGEKDKEAVLNFKAICNKPFIVDVNQGWNSVNEAIEKIAWLAEQQCLLVEQPLKKDMLLEMKRLKQNSSVPIYADESCQTLNDVEKMKDSFHGINIKLMKCGGITPALDMIKKAKQLNLKILIGCMSESSVGCTAAASLTPLADYADLDGPYLLANDPFSGMKVEHGRIVMQPGLSIPKGDLNE
jgi:L-alanine-DL-glutamate epimerase-like enolase superfamily enzyme